MQTYEIIASRVNEIGISKAELSRRVGINDELLRRSLIGMRKFTPDEFLCICKELKLRLSDFDTYRDYQRGQKKK